MNYTTEAIQSAAEMFGCEFITRAPQLRQGKLDFDPGQIGVITCDRPNQATFTIQRFQYLNDNHWQKVTYR